MTADQFIKTADGFTCAYVECALWSSTDDNDVPLDREYSIEDIADKTLDRIVADCAKFQSDCEEDISEENSLRYGPDCHSASARAGHDFWLTRNGHGAGFWDGDWTEPAATRLTEASKQAGRVDLYVGDDGRIYQ